MWRRKRKDGVFFLLLPSVVSLLGSPRPGIDTAHATRQHLPAQTWPPLALLRVPTFDLCSRGGGHGCGFTLKRVKKYFRFYANGL